MTPPKNISSSKRDRAADRLTVRRARADDRDAILEMSRSIWGGNDYLPVVWDKWVADREGVLLTVALNGRPVGCSKITVLSPGEVWLEGLRLHPELHGRGLSHRIHAATFREALRLKPKSIRYSTWIGNEASRHIAETHGFWLIAQTSWMWGNAVRRRLKSRRAEVADLGALFGFVRSSECYRAMSGLSAVGWKFPELTKRRLKRLASEGLALIYPRDGAIEAAALLDVGQIDNDLCLGFIDGPTSGIALLARDALALGAETGRTEVSAMLPEGAISRAVHDAGFDSEIPMQGVVYELGARGACGAGAGNFAEQVRRRIADDDCDDLESLLDRVYRSNQYEIAEGVAQMLVEKSRLQVNRQNALDFVLRRIVPDTTRRLMAAVHGLSNSIGQNDVRLVLRAVVMHIHSEYGLSGDAMTIGAKSVTVHLSGRRIVQIRCARNSITMALGPGFGACFPPDLDLNVARIDLDEKTRDSKSGRYERAVIKLKDRSQAKAAIQAVDIIMKSAMRREGKSQLPGS
jgi:RimJ/RimL family protein N-acetyltransferase